MIDRFAITATTPTGQHRIAVADSEIASLLHATAFTTDSCTEVAIYDREKRYYVAFQGKDQQARRLQ